MKKGFTLVELLAVIVILAVILVIAVPQINNVIKQTKMNSLGSTAKLIAAKAEEATVENEILESNEALTCANLVKLDDNYGNCTVTVTNGVGNVTIAGANKFDGITCTGTKSNMNCTEGSVEEGIYAFGSISSPSEGYSDYNDVKYPYPNNSPAQIFIKYPATGPYTNSTPKSVCTLYGGNLNCFEMNSSLYNTHKSNLQALFGTSNCTIGIFIKDGEGGGQYEYIRCVDGTNDSWSCGALGDNAVGCCAPDHYTCDVNPDGTASCNTY